MRAYLLAILSGCLFAASFAPIGLWPLGFVALVPFISALSSESSTPSRRRAFFVGWTFGATFFLLTVYWVVNSIFNFGGVPLALSIGIMLLLAAYLALYPALFALGFYLTRGLGPTVRFLFLPSGWVALEFLRAKLFTGFPWVLAGYSQTNNTTIIQMADIFGVWGVGFLVVAVNGAVALYITSRRERLRTPLTPILLAVIMVAGAASYGLYRGVSVGARIGSWPTVKVAVAQGNINQGLKWNSDYKTETLDIYRRLSLEGASAGAGLVVWPETAVPFFLAHDEPLSKKVLDVAVESSAYLLAGSPHYEFAPGGRTAYYNSAFIVSPSGALTQRYDKIKLVPFGEYVPLKKLLFFIDKLTVGVGDFTPGPGPRPLNINGESVGVLICFESIFPEIASSFVRNGASMLAVITNDAWFGKTSAAFQHYDMAVMRAVENRVFVVRAANTGVSGMIDPLGRSVKKTGIFTEEVFTVDAGLRSGPHTFYANYGMLMPAISILFSVAVLLSRAVVRR